MKAIDGGGWISLHRKIQEHWIWEDPVKLKWWLDILMTVNHSDNKVNIGYQLFECKRGQSVMSLSNWAKRWKVTKDKARNFLVLLENDGMIIHENIAKSTRITVCNYDDYQSSLHDSQTQSKRNPTQTIKNNNENNIYHTNGVYSFDDFWTDYDKRVGDKIRLSKKWDRLSDAEKILIKGYIPKYKAAQPEKKFRKNPETFINGKAWNDELVGDTKVNTNPDIPVNNAGYRDCRTIKCRQQ